MTETTLDEATVARDLLEQFGSRAHRRGSPVFLEVRMAGGRGLETKEILGRDGLLGHVVDPAYDAAAIVGTGRVRILDPSHEPSASLASGLGGGLRMACLVSRRGKVGWMMRLPDGSVHDTAPEEGFMLDVARRALGLPTPPPALSLVAMQLAVWLAALAGWPSGPSGPARMRWEEVVRLHPALIGERVADSEEAEDRIRSAAALGDWETMRRITAAAFDSPLVPSPELAAWMDAGMFSRWALQELPPLDAMLRTVRPRLQSAAYRRLAHLVRALDDRNPGP